MTALRLLVASLTLVAAATVSGTFAVTTAEAQANSEAALILRVLSYDRNLRSRASGRLTVLAIHGGQPGDCGEVVSAVNQLGRAVAVSGMRAHAVLHAYAGAESLISTARESGAVALYVCPGFDPNIEELTGATHAAHLLSISSREQHVRDGLTVAIVRGGSAPRLIVNVRAAQAEGARLDAALLRLATVIR